MEDCILEEFKFPTSHRRGSGKREDRFRMWEQQRGRCWWCQKSCTLEGPSDDEFTVDHVIPLSRFGTNHWRNLVGACSKCNWDRDQRWRNIRIRWIRPPELPPEVSTFSLKDVFSRLTELEFLPAKESR